MLLLTELIYDIYLVAAARDDVETVLKLRVTMLIHALWIAQTLQSEMVTQCIAQQILLSNTKLCYEL